MRQILTPGGPLCALAGVVIRSPPLFFWPFWGLLALVVLALLPFTCARVYFSVVVALSPFSWCS